MSTSSESDEASFLKAIADNPADETARLAYADWLTDRADPRAAVVRASAQFLSSVRELAELRRTDQHEWANVIDPLFGRLRTVLMPWDHNDGETVVCGVRVAPAQVVQRDELLLELISDRMETDVRAEDPGVVVCVLVKPGARVSLGAPLLTYLQLPIEMPLPPSEPPAVPLKTFIKDVEGRNDALRRSTPNRILQEFDRVHAAALMVFGSYELRKAFQAVWAAQGNYRPGVDKPPPIEQLEMLTGALRVLLAKHGQPTGFAELPTDEPPGE